MRASASPYSSDTGKRRFVRECVVVDAVAVEAAISRLLIFPYRRPIQGRPFKPSYAKRDQKRTRYNNERKLSPAHAVPSICSD